MTNDRAKEVLDGPILLVLARLVIPMATIVSIGIASWIGTIAIATLNKHTDQINEMNTQSKVFEIFLKEVTAKRDGEIRGLQAILTDHEARIRAMERIRR